MYGYSDYFSFTPYTYDPEFGIIVGASLGENGNKGRDYWITLRQSSDRLSSDFILIGTCQQGEVEPHKFFPNELVYNVTLIRGRLPESVCEHLNSCLQTAYQDWCANEEYIAELNGDENSNIRTWDMHVQWLRCLPEGFAQMIEGGEGDRFFVCQSRKELKILRRQHAPK